MNKIYSPRNKTIRLTESEKVLYAQKLGKIEYGLSHNVGYREDVAEVLKNILPSSVNLCIADPPYNMNKNFGEVKFRQISNVDYSNYLDGWFEGVYNCLREDGTFYVCGDWKTSSAIYEIGSKYFNVVNRITWERERGRSAAANWKNASEDMWMFTKSSKFIFNLDAVKLKRKVIAPYTDSNGLAKDWNIDTNTRLTGPSNLWTDIVVSFWSMPENTEHPTQKPEKVIAKLILASSNPGDLVLDLFSGSGTTSVVAKKLGRNYIYCDSDMYWCAVAEKRLEMAEMDKRIQGYDGQVFYHRNML